MQSQQDKDVCTRAEELIGITRALSNQENFVEILLTVLQDLENRMYSILRQDKAKCIADNPKDVSVDSIFATKINQNNEKIQFAINVMIELNRRLDV